MTTSRKAHVCSQISFRLGQFLLLLGIVCYLVSIITTHWVVRPTVDLSSLANGTVVTERYGIFKACKQPGSGEGGSSCAPLWKQLNYIEEGAVRFIQAVMIISGILYFVGIGLELVQILPIKMFRNFLAMNRVVEIFVGIASVLILTGMVVFAGEIKNKAERVKGQDEESTGWSFILGLNGLGLTVAAMVLTVMFRELPVPTPRAKGGSWVRNM